MSGLVLLIILVGVVLGYLSFLLYISLTSRGIALSRVYRVLGELWATFALIIAILAFITHYLGAVPAGSFAEELAARLAHWGSLSWAQQALIITGVLAAVLLFVHFILTLRTYQQRPIYRIPPSADGGDTE